MQTQQEILEKLFFHFDKINSIMDKFPNAIKIIESEETKYSLFIDLDLIEIHPEEKHLTLK